MQAAQQLRYSLQRWLESYQLAFGEGELSLSSNCTQIDDMSRGELVNLGQNLGQNGGQKSPQRD